MFEEWGFAEWKQFTWSSIEKHGTMDWIKHEVLLSVVTPCLIFTNKETGYQGSPAKWSSTSLFDDFFIWKNSRQNKISNSL